MPSRLDATLPVQARHTAAWLPAQPPSIQCWRLKRSAAQRPPTGGPLRRGGAVHGGARGAVGQQRLPVTDLEHQLQQREGRPLQAGEGRGQGAAHGEQQLTADNCCAVVRTCPAVHALSAAACKACADLHPLHSCSAETVPQRSQVKPRQLLEESKTYTPSKEVGQTQPAPPRPPPRAIPCRYAGSGGTSGGAGGHRSAAAGRRTAHPHPAPRRCSGCGGTPAGERKKGGCPRWVQQGRQPALKSGRQPAPLAHFQCAGRASSSHTPAPTSDRAPPPGPHPHPYWRPCSPGDGSATSGWSLR